MPKFNVTCRRLFVEEASISIEAANEEDAREMIEESLNNGDADNWTWSQMGIESESVESVQRLG